MKNDILKLQKDIEIIREITAEIKNIFNDDYDDEDDDVYVSAYI